MLNSQKVALAFAGFFFIAALALLVERGGLIAWGGVIIGATLLMKSWFKPSKRDLSVSVILAITLLLAWFGTRQYVLSTWESGEVVELSFAVGDGEHTARLWVMDIEGHPVVYYDAAPDAANALLNGTPVRFARDGKTSVRIPDATPVDELPETEANRVLEAMGTKYGDRNSAATVYYVMLGRPKDRVAVVVRLTEE